MDSISEKTDEQLVEEYVKLQKQADALQLEQDLLKEELKTRMNESGRDRFYCDYGAVQYSKFTKNQFSQKLAKEFLTAEEIEKCTEQKEMAVMKILSLEALEKQKDFLSMKG